jgi:hypothetical protein
VVNEHDHPEDIAREERELANAQGEVVLGRDDAEKRLAHIETANRIWRARQTPYEEREWLVAELRRSRAEVADLARERDKFRDQASGQRIKYALDNHGNPVFGLLADQRLNERDAARAEVEHLRAALTNIKDNVCATCKCGEWAYDIARRALAGEGGGQ